MLLLPNKLTTYPRKAQISGLDQMDQMSVGTFDVVGIGKHGCFNIKWNSLKIVVGKDKEHIL